MGKSRKRCPDDPRCSKHLIFSLKKVNSVHHKSKYRLLCLIKKKGRDAMQIKISLIIVDIKIASKALAFGMKKVLPSIIYYDQTAYVKGSYIGVSVKVN